MKLFFDMFKNGCEVEALQLSGIKRQELVQALSMIIGQRVQMMIHRGRPAPN